MAMSLGGLWVYQNLSSTSYRAAALGLLFPGAGFTAVGTLSAIGAFLLTLVLFPITIFIWFGMGGIFPDRSMARFRRRGWRHGR